METEKVSQSTSSTSLGCSRNLVTEEQLRGLINYVSTHPMLAECGSRAKLGGSNPNIPLWDECAKTLNTLDGVKKNWKGWSKYWYDWKYKVKKRAIEEQVCKEAGQPLPEGRNPLTSLEKRTIELIGKESLTNFIVKLDSLDENDYQDNEDAVMSDEAPSSAHISIPARSTRAGRKRRRSRSREDDVSSQSDECSHSVYRVPRRILELEETRLRITERGVQSLEAMTSQIRHIAEILDGIKRYMERESLRH